MADDLENIGIRSLSGGCGGYATKPESARSSSSAGASKASRAPARDDLVQRDFTAEQPNQLWLTDITEHHTGEGKLYLCAIKDVFSNRMLELYPSPLMDAKIQRA